MRKYEFKPWGSFINILDEKYTKVKQIVIKPGESPSYQYHHKRSEIWVIVQGTAEVRLNDVIMIHGVGDIIKIPAESKHQPKNVGDDDLIFIEIQLGEYFGEDDIVRLEDKYGRI
jgi:mannose-6-phosphate isomerase-like protein (cupin superfamily)